VLVNEALFLSYLLFLSRRRIREMSSLENRQTRNEREILKLASECLLDERFGDALKLTTSLVSSSSSLEKRTKNAFRVCANVARARAHLCLRQFAECLTACNEILRLKPNLAVANWLKAKALIGLGGVYEARIYLYKCRRSLSISCSTNKCEMMMKKKKKKKSENDELDVEIEAIEETCKHALPDDPDFRVEKYAGGGTVGGDSRGSSKRCSKKNISEKHGKGTNNDNEVDEDEDENDEEEGEEIYLIEEKTEDFNDEEKSAEKKKSSMTSWADEVEQEEMDEEYRDIRSKATHDAFIASIPMVSFVHLAIENDDAKKDCLDSLKKYGSVRVAMPDEAFDISLGETLAKVIECFESEYYECDDVEFFAPAWELNVEEEKRVSAEEKEEEKEEDSVVKTEGHASYANIAKKNARARSNGFNVKDSETKDILFPPLGSDRETTREWNEPPLEEDFGPRLTRRRETIFPTETFGTAVADATQILEMVAVRVVTSVLRQCFADIHEEKRQFHSVFNNLEGPSEEFLESQRKRNKNALGESFILRAQSGTLIARDDDNADDANERNESNAMGNSVDQNLFLTCEWLFDASLASNSRQNTKKSRERRKKPSQKYFTSNVELDGPIIHFTIGPAFRKKYASVNLADPKAEGNCSAYKTFKRLVRFSIRDEDFIFRDC
jgi:hypothetical protein